MTWERSVKKTISLSVDNLFVDLNFRSHLDGIGRNTADLIVRRIDNEVFISMEYYMG